MREFLDTKPKSPRLAPTGEKILDDMDIIGKGI